MQRNLSELKRARGLARDDDVRLLLAQLAEITRAAPQLAIGEVDVRGNTATLRGTVDAGTADTLRQQVKRMPGADMLAVASKDAGDAAAGATKRQAVEITVKAGS